MVPARPAPRVLNPPPGDLDTGGDLVPGLEAEVLSWVLKEVALSHSPISSDWLLPLACCS